MARAAERVGKRKRHGIGAEMARRLDLRRVDGRIPGGRCRRYGRSVVRAVDSAMRVLMKAGMYACAGTLARDLVHRLVRVLIA